MPSRRVYKHKNSYIHRPIGRGGKIFRFVHKQRQDVLFGGRSFPCTTFVDGSYLYKTTRQPMLMGGTDYPYLLNMLFESTLAGSAQTNLGEAKYPDMFNYRYLIPRYFGMSCRIIRSRLIIDTSDAVQFHPTPNDLINAELSTQVPQTVYWRADYSNLNDFYPFYKSSATSPGGAACQAPGYYNIGYNIEDAVYSQNFQEMLINKRFQKCVIQPGTECVMSIGSHFPTRALDGSMTDVRNSLIYNPLSVGNAGGGSGSNWNVVQWLRNYNSQIPVPGQAHSGGGGIVPGDLFMAPCLPETSSYYVDLINTPDEVEGPKARIQFDMEFTWTLILYGSEFVPDTQKLGSTGIPTF